MRLLLTNDDDAAAPWIASGLTRRLDELVWLPASALAAAETWSHRVEPDGRASTQVRFPDGREIDSRRVTGVVNRLRLPPGARTERARPADREYVMQEWWAFTMAWLASFECPVINPATANGLSGPPLHPLDLFAQAPRCGLACVPGMLSSADATEQGAHWDPLNWTRAAHGLEPRGLLVVGNSAVSDGRWEPARRTCLGAIALAERLKVTLLGLWFQDPAISRASTPAIVGATAHPDLRAFGEAGLDAIVIRLIQDAPIGATA